MEESSHDKQLASSTYPRAVYGDGVQPDIFVDPPCVLETMNILRISSIPAEHTVYVSGRFNIARKGLQLSKWIDRFVHGEKDRNEGEGSVVRVNTVLRGKVRSIDDMNRTLVHELEHVAQAERNDPKLVYGNIAIWGLTLAGALAGNTIVKRRGNAAASVIGMVVGAAAGHDIGYLVAPHERQARERARTVVTTAIYRNTDYNRRT
jgi:hypothetical protein